MITKAMQQLEATLTPMLTGYAVCLGWRERLLVYQAVSWATLPRAREIARDFEIRLGWPIEVRP